MSEVGKLYTHEEIERLLDEMIVDVRREFAPRTRRAKPTPPQDASAVRSEK